MENSGTRPISASDPSVNRHRPASERSQDICHVLDSTFKDIYTQENIGKDTVSNLTKARSCDPNDFHDSYVEELRQVHLDYAEPMREANALESHIIQARVRVNGAEIEEHERMSEEEGESYHELGLSPVGSDFEWCVDGDLLKKNNLICPQDYVPKQSPIIMAPAVKPNLRYAKPTFSYKMRVSREPQDDGYTLIPVGDKKEDAEEPSLTLETSSNTHTKRKTTIEGSSRARPRPKWKGEINAKTRAEEKDGLRRMKERQHFLRNPRFLPLNVQPGGKSLTHPRNQAERTEQGAQSFTDYFTPIFLPNPSAMLFHEYSVGKVYETTLELKNVTATCRHVRVIPPTTSYFSIGLGRFPGEGGMVAPGMSCKYTVRFTPDSLADFEDFILVETQAQYPLLVPIVARRPPPVLSLPSVLECGCCLMGGLKFVEFVCRNQGLSAGTFCIIPKSKWPVSNLRSVVKTKFAERPPFAISPPLFHLEPGQTTVVEVIFFPTRVEKYLKDFTIVCDNCQVKDITVQGEGQFIALELVSVSGEEEPLALGEMRDLTAEHFIRFSSSNPHSVQQKKVVIKNNVDLELPFYWQIMKPNLQALFPGDPPDPAHIQFHPAKEGAFQVSPPAGQLAPRQNQEFLFTFGPKELKDYHSVCHLVVRDVPQFPMESTENSTGVQNNTAPKTSNVIVMEIEVKGSTEPHHILLEPYAVTFPGETLISRATRRNFKMWNHCKSLIHFQWERISGCHVMEVEPCAGDLEVNECFDLDLIVTGGKPEKVLTHLLCHIQNHQQAVTLAVEVTFKGPSLTLSAPSLDLGLIRLGDQVQTTVHLTNASQIEASWSMEERQESPKQGDHPQVEISLQPRAGWLPPMSSCNVVVIFKPCRCRHLDTVLELQVEKGTGCYLLVQADVQSPQLCLLNCELVFSEIYIGVPATGVVTLFNQTLLPAHFTWMSQLKGKQASLCAASFDPSTGTLGPNAKMNIKVTFTSQTDLEVTKASALCEVQGMKVPLVLEFYSKAKRLDFSFSIPSKRSVSEAPEDQSSLVLDFGDDVVLKKAVSKRLVITNHTAITAPFVIEAEYFTGHAASAALLSERSRQGFTHMKKPLHSIQAKRVEEREQEEFVKSLLSHGKGAAFFIFPSTGTLKPFGSQNIVITAHTEMWGEYRDQLICTAGDLEPRRIPMQMRVSGCPLYYQIIGPRLDDQNQGPTVQFGTHVSGGDTVCRSFRINNPSPYDIRMDWETYNLDKDNQKLLDMDVIFGDAFPVKDAAGRELVGGMLALSDDDLQLDEDQEPQSHTPGPEETGSSPESQSKKDEEKHVTEKDSVVEESSVYPKRKLISVYIKPHIGNVSDYPYFITPQQIMIPAKGSSTIHVSFTPLTLYGSSCEKCEGFALGFLSLDSRAATCIPGKVQRAQGLDFAPVRMDLKGVVKHAQLSVQMEDDEEVVQFSASAGELLRGESESELLVEEFDNIQSLQLKNTTEMPLYFRLATQPPFYVLHPHPRAQTNCSSNTPTSNGELLELQPRSCLQVRMAFHCSLSLLDQARAKGKGGSSVGRTKLRFQDDLLIHYSNNSLQRVSLCAHLDLATLSLSTNKVDFGTCYVGQSHVVELHICCEGVCSFWRAIIDGEGSHVFKVTPKCGVLRPLESSHISCRKLLHISFTASEARDFRACVTFEGVFAEPPVSLHVKGRGTFDENFKSDLVSLYNHTPSL